MFANSYFQTYSEFMKNKKFETESKVVFAAMSKRNFYLREHIIKFILNEATSFGFLNVYQMAYKKK